MSEIKMPRFETREHTIADNFHITATVGSLGQFERAFSIAFNESTAEWYAETKKFGLIFFSFLSDKEKRDVNRPVEYPLSSAPAEKIEYESYIIKPLRYRMSVGPSLVFALDWLKNMDQDRFEVFAGPPAFQWDVWSEVVVLISTGSELNQEIGTHSGAVCHVKPRWMYVGK